MQQIDEATLTEIAETTGGEYFKADNAEALTDVLRDLPSNIVLQEEDVEISVWFVLAGVLLTLAAVGLAQWWNRSAPLATAPNMTAPQNLTDLDSNQGRPPNVFNPRTNTTGHDGWVKRARFVGGLMAAVTATTMLAACGQPARPGTVSALPTAPAAVELPPPPAEQPPDFGPFANATVTIPGWGAGVTSCPSGRRTMTDGYLFDQAMNRSVFVMSYAAVDVDRDGAEDYVADVRCGEGPESPGWQVVAFRRSGQALVPLGRVIGSQDGLAMVSGVEGRDAGRVAVNLGEEYTDAGEETAPHQWRDVRLESVDGSNRSTARPRSRPTRRRPGSRSRRASWCSGRSRVVCSPVTSVSACATAGPRA